MIKINAKPDLSWTKADFLNAKVEVPEALCCDDIHSQGELLDSSEVANWLTETQKTLCQIKPENPELFETLNQKYVLDVHYLTELGKITEEESAEL